MKAMALEVTRLSREHLGSSHVMLADGLDLLGDAQMHLGDLPEAETSLRTALLMKRELLSGVNKSVAVSLGHLSQVLRNRGSLQEAEQSARGPFYPAKAVG